MSAMATDGATLDCFLNKLMALSTVCPGSRGAMRMDRPALRLNFSGVGEEDKESSQHL